MNEAGVFGKFVPEFRPRRSLDAVQPCTTITRWDRSILIRAVGNVASIERGEFRRTIPSPAIWSKRVKRREVLYCAMLMHDIAKGPCRAIIPTSGAAIAESS